MSSEQEEIIAIDRFREDMLRKLRANCHKPHWRTADFASLYTLLCRKVMELAAAHKAADTMAIINEAADVANFAMMMADNVRAGDR